MKLKEIICCWRDEKDFATNPPNCKGCVLEKSCKKQISQIRKELLGSLPNESKEIKDINQLRFQAGFNDCLDECQKVIKSFCEEE